MADGFVELDVMSGGDKIDAESLTVAATPVLRERVQLAGVADTEIARVDDVPLATNLFGLGVRRIMDRSSIFTLHSAVTIDNSPSSDSASLVDVSLYREVLLYIALQRSAAPPTKFILAPEFSDDGGTDWFEDRDNLFEFTDMQEVAESPNFLRLFHRVPIIGRDFRTTISGEGLDATHAFTVTVTAEAIK
jgi:hypothetical protein